MWGALHPESVWGVASVSNNMTNIDNLITYESLLAILQTLDPPVWPTDRWSYLTGDAAVLGDAMLEAQNNKNMWLGMALPQCPIVHRQSNAFGWMWWAFEPEFESGVLTNPQTDLYQPITGFPDMFVIKAPTVYDSTYEDGYHRCRVLCLLDTLGILPPMYHGIPPEYQI